MAYEHISYDVADGVLTITLDRPEQLNAFTETMQRELIDACDRADADDSVRAFFPGVIHHAAIGIAAGFLADLGIRFDIAADHLLQPAEQSLPDARRAHDNSADDAEELRDPGAGDFVSRRDDDGGHCVLTKA